MWPRRLPALVLPALLASTLAGCAGSSPAPDSPSNADATTGNPPVAAAAVDDPYPGVNTVGYDRNIWQTLLSNHEKIRRDVVFTETGVEAVTESDDPKITALIKNHAHAMHARMKTGASVRIWDPVFAELFANYQKVTLTVTDTDKGVRIVESSDDPKVVALLWSHAAGVNDFVRRGHDSSAEATKRIEPGEVPERERVGQGW